MDPERWRKIESIFHQALDAGQDSRQRILMEACAGDASLRREVEALLSQHQNAEEFMEQPAFAGPARAPLPTRPHSEISNSAGIAAGTVIGHYRLVGKIGSGGMGVVYEAQDLKLRRHVALKFLPHETAGAPGALQRFRLEAQAASVLNHPNICTIYEVDEVNGLVFIAMEILKGQTLKETISGKPLPLEAVIDFGAQIARAIDAAHARGIVHRDIKPANIFVIKQRRIKVLDFGLAKLTRISSSFEETGMAGETEPGMVMGTVGYMSPEQLRGHRLDGRADIFALGAVLYEMLAGRRAFEKNSSAETMAAILHEEPPNLSAIAPHTPPLVRIVKRCLEKDPDQRFQSASDLAFALEALAEPSGAVPAAGEKQSPPRRLWVPVIISMALVVVALILWKMLTGPKRVPRVVSFTQLTNDGKFKTGPMATDGSRIYFSESVYGGFLHHVIHQVSVKGGEVTALPLPLVAPGVSDISKDGTELLLSNFEIGQGNSYWVAPVAGGAPRRVGLVIGAVASSFGADGTSVIYNQAPGVTSNLYSINRDGSASRKLLTTDGYASSFRFSPDGSRLRLTLENSRSTSIMEAASNGTGLTKMFDGCWGEWTADGRFFTFQRDLNGRSNIWVSRGQRSWWNSNDTPNPLIAGASDFTYPLPSKDGKQIFAIAASRRGEVVRYDARSGAFIPFLGSISAEALAFSKDGKWVTYTTYPEGTLWRSKVDGTERLQLTFPPTQAFLPRWSPDGKQIVFSAKLPGSAWSIYLIPSEGGTPAQILPSEHGQMDANWSPDGNSLVFATDDPTEPIYTVELKTKRVSALPGSKGFSSSHWSPDGRFIAALGPDNTLVIFDSTKQEWTKAWSDQALYETFSRDGKYVYFFNIPFPDWKPRVLRFRMSDRKVEEVVDLQPAGSLLDGTASIWFGLAPDDSPMVTRDISTQEIYALKMDWP